MKYTQPINYEGIESIKNNIDLYYDKFVDDSIIVFRNANINFEEHEKLQRVLGDRFGWFPNSTLGGESRYIENHAPNRTLNKDNKDTVVLDWHIEHPFFTNPIVGALWNMYKFTTDNDNGKTYFVDTRRIYEMLSENEKDFLNKSVANAYSYNHTDSMHECKVITPHWITGEPVIRMQLHRVEKGWHDLKRFDDRQPTESEQNEFIRLANWVVDQVWNNEDLRIVHKWQQGDVVVPDLYCLAHAITGGFDPKDREFTGLWSFQMDNNTVPLYNN